MKKIAIFGCSGFAKEVADIAIDQGYDEIIFIVPDDAIKADSNIVHEKEISQLTENYVFAIGAGEPKIREKIYNKFKTLNFINLIHSSATFGNGQLQKIELNVGVIICAGVRFTNSIEVGDFSIFNLNTTVGHDAQIGKFVSCMPGCNISGNVKLSDSVYIGTGAIVLQGKTETQPMIIEENSIIGAGAVVTKLVKKYTTVVGSPARAIN
ncbi:MAG: sugar O-acyltransferase (sialic acid O-acetyltransferase NeuD family) [Flavobacteriales bacterium]|jgi:sugar O-acyltransferase (sialic acid O-acetyltransferase NeuD family)